MRILGLSEKFIATARPAYLILFLLTASLLKCGIWFIPSIYYIYILSTDPFRNPYHGTDQYLFWNWLGPFLAWEAGLKSFLSFLIFNSGISVLFLVLTFATLYRCLDQTNWRKAICLFICLPVSWTHFYWIGYDSLTLVLMSIILALIRFPFVALVGGIGLGLQHAQQSAVGLSALLFIVINGRQHINSYSRTVASTTMSLAGVLGGYVILKLIVSSNEIIVNSGRFELFVLHSYQIVRNNAMKPDVFLYGLLGVSWLSIIRYFKDGPHFFNLAIALGGCAFITFLTIDVTRVFAVITYPAIYFCLLHDGRWLSTVSFKHVSTILLIWLFVPWLFDWEGKLRMTAFPYDIAVILHLLIGRFTIPDDVLLWPFI